jgi:sigma-E factor negative regulatory protein RseC
MKNEVIEVSRGQSDHFSIGDHVEVLMEKSMGTKAVLLGYFFPFVLLLSTLIIALNIIDHEGFAGLISIAVLVPYYAILYLSRDKLKNKFRFRIR